MERNARIKRNQSLYVRGHIVVRCVYSGLLRDNEVSLNVIHNVYEALHLACVSLAPQGSSLAYRLLVALISLAPLPSVIAVRSMTKSR
jgi:hypothetical protein